MLSADSYYFALLVRFVVELKKGKGGWVAPSDLVEGGFINDIEHRQRYSQLREHFKGSLKEKDGEKFIECDPSKGYRLSTHPDFVKRDREKLRNHPDPKVIGLLKGDSESPRPKGPKLKIRKSAFPLFFQLFLDSSLADLIYVIQQSIQNVADDMRKAKRQNYSFCPITITRGLRGLDKM